MNKRIIIQIVMVLSLVLSSLPLQAAKNGIVKNLFPPSNNGQSRGAGMIDGDSGNNLVFKTPGDNNYQILSVGQKIYYTISEDGKHIESVSTTDPDIDTCEPTIGQQIYKISLEELKVLIAEGSVSKIDEADLKDAIIEIITGDLMDFLMISLPTGEVIVKDIRKKNT